MPGNIKGITIEIGGDTTKLGKALTNSERQTRDLQKELKQVNTALKFNPNNIELLAQKQKILTDQIEATKNKLNSLKEAESQVEAQFNAGEIGEEQFRAFQREIIETESKLKTYESQLEAVGKKSSALEELNTSISDQEKKVNELKNEWKNAVLTYGEGSDEANKLANEIDELSSELNENKTKMSELDKAADNLDNSLGDVDSKTDKTTGGFTVMKGALADLVSQGIQKAISALKDLGRAALDAYDEFDEGYDNLIKATGATGDMAKSLEDSYTKVSKSVRGDMGDIGSVVGEVNTRFEQSGKKLEDTSVKFVKFADITGTDTTEAVRLVSRAMGDAQIESGELNSLLDELAAASQTSGVSVEKLTENITKYGAPMRALGFDTQESIALFSQWEKTGVNTEIAFSGMKKAISNWSKEGKDARVEFKKTLDDIEATPNIAEATTKAIEIFGAKAGPDLADAIKGGRFEYKKFLDQLGKSEGTVENTYKQTQSGMDKIKLAIQKARVEMGNTVKKLSDKYGPQIEKAIDKATDVFDDLAETVAELFTFIVEHGDTIVGTIKTIATAFVTYKAVGIIMNVIGAFQQLSAAIKAGEAVTQAFNGTLAANPVGLVAGAIGGLVVGLNELADADQRAMEKAYGLSEEQQKLVDKIHEEKQALDERNAQREENNAGIDAEISQTQNLWSELQTIVDENGKIKKGYEDRAGVITGLLADSLGIEIEIVDGQIQKYGELKKSIDEVIQNKRAEALLEANKEAYTTAIQNQTEAYTNYTRAAKDAKDTENELAKAKERLNELDKIRNDTAGKDAVTIESNNRLYNQQKKVVEELGKKYATQSAAADEAQSTYLDYANTIKNYQGVMAAVAEGDADKLADSMDNLSNSFVTADNATREMLEDQASRFMQSYRDMQAAVDAGMPGVSQAQVDAMGEMVEKSLAELEKLPPEAEKTGDKTGFDFAEALRRKQTNANTAGTEVSNEADKGLGSADTKKTGEKKGYDFKEGIKRHKTNANTAGKEISNETDKGLGSADTGKTGEQKANEYAEGIKRHRSNVNSAGKSIGNEAKSGAESIHGTGSGGKFGTQYKSGIESKKQPSRAAGTAIGNEAKSGADSVKGDSSGKNFAQGFINGISSLARTAFDTAFGFARKTLSGLKTGQKEGSPSKITTQSGIYFGEGFINGIRSKIADAIKAAKDLAKQSIGALDTTDMESALFGDMGINGMSFDRQLEINSSAKAPDYSAILERLDRVETAILNSRGAIVLDTGVLVGETINQIDSGLADVYNRKARGI